MSEFELNRLMFWSQNLFNLSSLLLKSDFSANSDRLNESDNSVWWFCVCNAAVMMTWIIF